MSLICMHNGMACRDLGCEIKVFSSVHFEVTDKVGEGRESVKPRKQITVVSSNKAAYVASHTAGSSPRIHRGLTQTSWNPWQAVQNGK